MCFIFVNILQKASEDYKALEEEYGKIKEKADASKARNKVLSNELKTLKQQMATLKDKGKHDDELIEALLVSDNLLWRCLTFIISVAKGCRWAETKNKRLQFWCVVEAYSISPFIMIQIS